MKLLPQDKVLTQQVPHPSEWSLDDPVVGVDYGQREALVTASVAWLAVVAEELSGGANGTHAAAAAGDLERLAAEAVTVNLHSVAKRAQRTAMMLRAYARTDDPADLATACAALAALRGILE